MMSILKGAIGTIHSINPENYTAKVKLDEFPDAINRDLQILTPLSFINKESCIPKVGTPVICIFLSGHTDIGFIIGAFYSETNKSEGKEGEYSINFQNSVLKINENGNVDIKASLTTIDSKVTIKGDTVIEKSLKVNQDIESTNGYKTSGIKIKDGDIKAEGKVKALKFEEGP